MAAAPRRAAQAPSKRTSRASLSSRGAISMRRSQRGSSAAAFSGHSTSFRPGPAKTSRKPASSHSCGIVEAIEVEVRDLEAAAIGCGAIRLHQRVGRALDRAGDAERVQQVAHEGRLAGAERAVQLDEGVAQAPARARQRAALARARGLVGPRQRCGFLESAPAMSESHVLDGDALLARMRAWGRELGFSQIGVADIDLSSAERHLLAWLANGFHGAMDYMAAHGMQARPAGRARAGHGARRHGAPRLPAAARPRRAGRRSNGGASRASPSAPAISLYARGRDYHKVAARPPAEAGRADRRRRSARSAIASSPIRRRCSRSSSPPRAASAGAASTRWRSTARPARCSSSARSTSTWRCRRRRRSSRTAAAAAPASTSARPRPSSARIGSTRGAASPT